MDIDWRVKVEELNLAKRWDAAFGESPRKHWTLEILASYSASESAVRSGAVWLLLTYGCVRAAACAGR